MDLTSFDKFVGGGLLAGRKTYLAAGLLALTAVVNWLAGNMALADMATRLVEAFGLAGLRAGIAKAPGLKLKTPAVVGALALAVLLLPGCTTMPSDTIGDMLLAEADTTEERVTRLICVASIVAELAHERVSSREPLDASATSAALVRLAVPLKKAGEDSSGDWTETDLFYAKREILRMGREYGSPRVASLAATGPTVGGALASAGRAGLMNAMRIDVKRLLEAPNTTGPPAAEARAVCRARFDKRLDAIKSMAGEG